MPEKNKIYRITIDTMNHTGYGIGRISGVVCFVKGGVTGDTLDVKVIKANKNYCQSNYLDPENKSSTKKDFYTHEAVDALLTEYERLEATL